MGRTSRIGKVLQMSGETTYNPSERFTAQAGPLRACSDRRPSLTLRKRFCHPAFSIDLAITERDLGPPYSPLLSNSQSLCVSQSAKCLNTASMACCLDLIPEASCPCCVRNARTLLIFGMNVFFSYFSASIRRVSFFSLSTISKASTKSVRASSQSWFAIAVRR